MGFRNPITSLVDPVARAAAADAQTAANNALAVASSRNHVFVQTSAPTTLTAALALDDLWINPANGYQIRSWDGSAWQPVAFGTAAIAAAAITTDLIAAGAIGAGQIAANAIDGKTITGATVHAGTLDTGASTSAPGVTLSQGGTTGPDITTTYGQVAFRDGFSGDSAATITRRVTVNPNSNATSGAGSLILDGGSYGGLGGTHAPTLTLGVVAGDGPGVWIPTARVSAAFSALQSSGISWVSGFIADYGAGFMPSQVRLMADGRVQLSGVVKNVNASAIAAASVIGTLPSWATPTSGTVILGLISNAGLMHVDVGTDAKLRLQTSLPSTAWISLTSTYVPA